MDNLVDLIDKLSDEELMKLNSHLDQFEKTAEARVYSINSGRFMAREFAKHASSIFSKMDDGFKKTVSLKAGLEKTSASGKSPYPFLFKCEYSGKPDLHKLASAEHYFENGGAAIAALLGVFS